MGETVDTIPGLSDLRVDAEYRGGRSGNFGDDPLPDLLGVKNQGGFRFLGSVENPNLMVLTTSLADPDWPDDIDRELGILTYYGDNKKPGSDLHRTPLHGNKLLRLVFDAVHSTPAARHRVPPILAFARTGTYRDLVFLGLAVPGSANLTANDDLVAVWRIADGRRFQNYRAKFTILDCPVVPRPWIDDALKGHILDKSCPLPWREWVETGRYSPLRATLHSKSEPRMSNFQRRRHSVPSSRPYSSTS